MPRYLSQSEVQRFFAVITDPRDQALFSLIYLYGLRVGEVALIARGDVDFERARIVVKRLKGGAWSERPLFRSAAILLQQFLGARGVAPEAPLFPGKHGPLKKRQIRNRRLMPVLPLAPLMPEAARHETSRSAGDVALAEAA